jgi:hypothetical protein
MPSLVMAGAVGLLALPSAVMAFSTRFDMVAENADSGSDKGGFASAEMDARGARAMAARQQAQFMQGKEALYHFTPAGLATRPDRSVTVAVRVDAETARAIVVRGPALNAQRQATGPNLRVAPDAYNLGLSRGYQSFSSLTATYSLPGNDRAKHDLPDLSAFPRADPNSDSRLAPHIQLVDRERAGRAPRTLESLGEQSVDVGGSYRVTRNFDVTAGVRYSQDRDRLKPTNDTKSDSQSVFVGTQFHF